MTQRFDFAKVYKNFSERLKIGWCLFKMMMAVFPADNDGLLDIKNEFTFITVSRCIVHDHFKTSLISLNDSNDILLLTAGEKIETAPSESIISPR